VAGYACGACIVRHGPAGAGRMARQAGPSGGSGLRGDWRTVPLRPQVPAVGGTDTRAPLQRSCPQLRCRAHGVTKRRAGVVGSAARRPPSTRPDRDLSSKPRQPLHAETPSPRRHRPARLPQPLSDPRGTPRQQDRLRPAPRPGSAPTTPPHSRPRHPHQHSPPASRLHQTRRVLGKATTKPI